MMQLLTIIYALCAVGLGIYTLGQLGLLVQYWRHRHHRVDTPAYEPSTLPQVTVQLPVYNERFVVVRLLRAVAALDYPADRLHIQLLDDSTDTTTKIAAAEVKRLQQAGVSISRVRRTDRDGYKAGALSHGLTLDSSEFVAIFDADFVPPPDFLLRTIPHLLADECAGVVQTRWGHINGADSALTQAQRLMIDTHFVIEQRARSESGWLLPFNGTGGVWRRACIDDAGGWSDVTLTEDLDLSYRAQMRGWRSIYLPDVVVPGELPAQIAAYKQQQARWACGSTQNLRRHGWQVLRQGSVGQRIMGLHHLCQYIPQPLMLILLLLTPPLLLAGYLDHLPLAPLGILSLIPPAMIALGQREIYPAWGKHMWAFPALLLVATGMMWSNSVAVAKGMFADHLQFARTPKFARAKPTTDYHPISARIPTESLLCLYALFAAVLAWRHMPALVPYLLIYALSFGTVTVSELFDRVQLRRKSPPRPKSFSHAGEKDF